MSGFGAGVTASGTSGSKPGNRLSAHHGCRSGLGFFCWLAGLGRCSVFVKASRERESAGVCVVCTDLCWLQQLSLAAGGYCEVCVCVGVLRGRFCPLTPDPSPPFHGGEGGLVFVKASRGRESAGVCLCVCVFVWVVGLGTGERQRCQT